MEKKTDDTELEAEIISKWDNCFTSYETVKRGFQRGEFNKES